MHTVAGFHLYLNGVMLFEVPVQHIWKENHIMCARFEFKPGFWNDGLYLKLPFPPIRPFRAGQGCDSLILYTLSGSCRYLSGWVASVC